MNIVLLQTHLSEEEIKQLINEFPQFLFLSPSEANYKKLGKEEWAKVEILYGNRLSQEELANAHQLRWIHSPLPNLNPLCLKDIVHQGNVVVTRMKEENVVQIGEYVMGGILAFGKNLFHWQAADRNPVVLWDSKWRESMWALRGKVLLQIGLGRVGSEIAKCAKQMGMHVWGAQEHRTFHPDCDKVFSFQELHSVLPSADVVCIAFPRGKQKDKWFKRKEIDLMKQDSILVIIGSKNIIDEDALAEISEKTGKFRGILLDAFYQVPVAPGSRLWEIPNIIITPEVAPRPRTDESESFSFFRYNLRQYAHGNLSDMRNIIGTRQTFIT